jgi:hypothetical protein
MITLGAGQAGKKGGFGGSAGRINPSRRLLGQAERVRFEGGHRHPSSRCAIGERGSSLAAGPLKVLSADPYAYLRDVLERLPLTPEHRLEELLPHVWKPADAGRMH